MDPHLAPRRVVRVCCVSPVAPVRLAGAGRARGDLRLLVHQALHMGQSSDPRARIGHGAGRWVGGGQRELLHRGLALGGRGLDVGGRLRRSLRLPGPGVRPPRRAALDPCPLGAASFAGHRSRSARYGAGGARRSGTGRQAPSGLLDRSRNRRRRADLGTSAGASRQSLETRRRFLYHEWDNQRDLPGDNPRGGALAASVVREKM